MDVIDSIFAGNREKRAQHLCRRLFVSRDENVCE
jgi:hypothetical protein